MLRRSSGRNAASGRTREASSTLPFSIE